MKLQEAKKMYSEIFGMIRKYGDETVFNIGRLEERTECHLFGIKLKEEYGLDIDPKAITRTDYATFCRHRSITLMGEKHRRTISWSDDGRQPEDELLLNLSFSSGAYIFGGHYDNDYPTEFFNDFFEELKTYKPKYVDTVNHKLYFSMDNAADIFNNFEDILKKYRELDYADRKKRRIKKMKKELDELESE